MSFLSENSNIVTSYQRNRNSLPAMTTMTNTNEKPIDAKNVSEIWKNNFSMNNNNNTNTTNNNANTDLQLNGSTHVLKTWGNMNNNQENEMDETTSISHQPNDKEAINVRGSEGANWHDSPSNGTCKVDIEKVSNDEENDNNRDNESKDQKEEDGADTVSPSHHARRPMNAFLIFCKKHRPIVRNIFPTLENRGVTRILGEWWSLLDAKDKDPYTKLAKQYKDAFFDAHPDFKWYKLPAPPLRTLPTRPTKPDPPPPVTFMSPTTAFLERPTSASITTGSANATSPCGLFTPGKLADESQIGMLSSLFTAVPSPGGNQYKTDQEITYATSIVKQEIVQHSEPPKPLKKRIAAEAEVKTVSTKLVRNLFEKDAVDQDDETGSNGRKSHRKGKGNRYADIMANGRLIRNKRSGIEKANEGQLNMANNNLELTSTIKKLQERLSGTNGIVANMIVGSTRPKSETQEHEGSLKNSQNTQNHLCQQNHCNSRNDSYDKRSRTMSEISEISDVADYSKAIPSFDLDARISELPNLSYDTYIQKKKATKKRKPKNSKNQNKAKRVMAEPETNKKRTFVEAELDLSKTQNGLKISKQAPNGGEKQTGSKKRKNKHNITHLKNNTSANVFENDMSGLNTLAEIASNLSCNNNDGGFVEKMA